LDLDESETTLALKWEGEPSHSRRAPWPNGSAGFPRTVAAARPLIMIMEGNVARLIDRLLRTELGITGDIVSLDGIQLREFDYVDIGEPVQPADVIPLITSRCSLPPATRASDQIRGR
jgi:ethanolamine utilization protein EutA